MLASVGLFGFTLATLLVSAVETRVLDRDFIVRHLDRGGVFEQAAAVGVPAETRRWLVSRYPAASRAVQNEVAIWAGRLVTADFLQRCTTRFVDAALRYLQDDRSSLDVTLPIADRVEAVRHVLEDRIDESPLAAVAYDRLLDAAAERIASVGGQALPFGVTTDLAVWHRALRLAVSPEWLAGTLDGAVGALADWMTGATDRLQLHLPLQERQSGIGRALELVAAESAIDEYLKEHVVRPALVDRLDERAVIPDTDVVFERDELVRVLEGLADLEWAREQRELVVGVLVDYLTRQRDDLTMTVDLRPLVAPAAERLTTLVSARVKAWLAERRVCKAGETTRIFVGALSPLACRPTGAPAKAIDFLVEAFIRDQVARGVADAVPTAWTLDEGVVRENLANDAWDLLQRARQWMATGVVLDASDVGQLLEAGQVTNGAELLEGWRRVVLEGVHVGLADLVPPETVTEPLDMARGGLALLERARAPVALAVALCVLLAVWGGWRGPRARLRLLGLPLTLAAVGAILVTGLAEEQLAVVQQDATLGTSFEDVVRGRLPDVAHSMVGEIARAAELGAQSTLLLGLMLLGGSLLVRRDGRVRGRRNEPPGPGRAGRPRGGGNNRRWRLRPRTTPPGGPEAT